MGIKKLLCGLTAAALALSSLTAFTASADTNIGITDGELDETTNLLYTPLEDDSTKCKVSFLWEVKPEGDVVIPESYNGMTVTELDGAIFACTSNVTSVTIPATVTKIQTNSFTDSNALTSIVVDPNNENFISEDGVLYNKDKTELIKYPSKKAGSSFEVPNTVTTIDMFALSGTELEDVTLNEGLVSLGDAFVGCKKLKKINIPKSVTRILGGLCRNSGIEEITVTEGNPNFQIKNDALYENEKNLVAYPCGRTNESYEIAAGTEIIRGSVFEGAESLKSITVPDGVLVIDGYAFANTGIESITLPESVSELGWGVFMGCTGLKELTLPKSITSIKNQTFADYSGQYEGSLIVNYGGTKEDWDKIEISSKENQMLNGATVKCSDGTEFKCEIGVNVVQDAEVVDNEDGSKNYVPKVVDNAIGSIPDGDLDIMKGITATAKDAFEDPTAHMCVNNATFPQANSGAFTADIHFENENGDEIQPTAPVTVRIPLPERFANKDPLYVYHIKDGKAEKVEMKTETIGETKYIVFEASSFSTYVVTDEEIKDTGDDSNPTTPSSRPAPTPSTSTGSSDSSNTTSDSDLPAEDNGTVLSVKAADSAFDSEMAEIVEGIELNAEPGVIEFGTELVVKPYNGVNAEDGIAFDITLVRNDKEVQPNGKVNVRIPVPDSLKGGKVYVFHIENGEYKLVNSTVYKDIVTFEADSFSPYVLSNKDLSVAEEDSETEITSSSEKDETSSDVNSDSDTESSNVSDDTSSSESNSESTDTVESTDDNTSSTSAPSQNNTDTSANVTSSTTVVPESTADTAVSNDSANPPTGVVTALIPAAFAAVSILVAVRKKK